MNDLATVIGRHRAGPAASVEGPRELRLEPSPGAAARATFDERGTGEWRVVVEGEAVLSRQDLAWLEAVARDALAAELAAGAPVLLCRDFDHEPEPAVAREAEAAGFELTVAEDEMRRPTSGAPERPLPAGFTAVPFGEQAAPLFHHAYFEAFRGRPGFPGWDEQRWRAAYTSGDDFRPDLSVVILDGSEPAAFAVLWVEDGTGWVIQMGVQPGWRGKGLGEALLSHALRAFAAEGIETAALEVATNNPEARALYARMGFEVAGKYRSWRKRLSPESAP